MSEQYEMKATVLGVHPVHGELISASAAKEAIEHFDAIAKAELAKANERVVELEKSNSACAIAIMDLVDRGDIEPLMKSNEAIENIVNKFAIDKKVEAINEALDYYEELKASEEPIGAGSILHVCLGRLISQQKQLRKEQEHV